jgi:hypothetical protein
VRAVLLVLALVAGPAQAPGPAALAVGKDCFGYAETHTLVRNDVLAKMDAAEENLPKCESALAKAQADLQALNAAFDKLQGQKTQLVEHVDLLERVLKEQREACVAGRSPAQDVGDAVGAAWEWADAPLAFTAGAGMCVGLAWGLTQVQR